MFLIKALFIKKTKTKLNKVQICLMFVKGIHTNLY